MTTAQQSSRSRGRTLGRMLLEVVAMATCLWSYLAPAQALPVPQATSCAGIWVVVDYGALGGTATVCAGSYSTGMVALRSAGFAPTLDAGLVAKINGLPAVSNIQQSYWSYWHATRQADGSYSGWSYSSLGPSSFHPTSTDAEGWRYAAVAGGYVEPGAAPPKLTATTQGPATTAPAATARTTAAATKAATTTAGGQRTTQAAPVVTTGPDSSAPSSSAPTETALSTQATADSSPPEIAPPAHPASTSTSSLLGGVGAIGAIALGAAGVLLWRKRAAARG